MEPQEQLTLFELAQPGAAARSERRESNIPVPRPEPVRLEEQSVGNAWLENRLFHYRGYVLDLVGEGAWYLPYEVTFTPAEVDCEETCLPDRIAAMVDLVGRDRVRQEEIARYGRRKWHSPYRPESAPCQALDFAFLHLVQVVEVCLPATTRFFATTSVQRVDSWVEEITSACQQWWYEEERLLLLLAEAGVEQIDARRVIHIAKKYLRPRILTR